VYLLNKIKMSTRKGAAEWLFTWNQDSKKCSLGKINARRYNVV